MLQLIAFEDVTEGDRNIRRLRTLKFAYQETNVNGYRNKVVSIPHNPAHEFNETTLNAVLDFQKRNGLDADGIVDYKTWEMLFFHDERPKYGITESDFDRAAMLLDCEPAAQRALHQGKQVYACRFAEKGLESVCPSL